MFTPENLSNDVITPFYAAILSIDKNKTAKDGRTFHVLEVSDSVRSLKLYYWSDCCPFEPKTYIKFTAEVVTSQSLFLSSKEGQVVSIPFQDLPAEHPVRSVIFRFNVDPEELSLKFKNATKYLVKEESFKELLLYVTDVKLLSVLKDAPAAKSVHHALEGGLLKHIEEMLDMYVALSACPEFVNLRHEFVLLGIALHDFYKFKEYEQVDGRFTVTANSALLGHIYQGAQFLQRAFSSVEKSKEFIFEELDKEKAVHTLLAHHGQLDWGSPVVPAIPEAAVLHYIDQLSAKLNMFKFAAPLEFNKYLGTSPVK